MIKYYFPILFVIMTIGTKFLFDTNLISLVGMSIVFTCVGYEETFQSGIMWMELDHFKWILNVIYDFPYVTYDDLYIHSLHMNFQN